MSTTSSRHLYETFELRIGTKNANDYPITANQTPTGDARTICRLNAEDEPLRAMLAAIASEQANETILLGLGSILFGVLFSGDIAALYRSSLALLRGQGRKLRLRLIVEPPELAILPWELLYDPLEESFLAISSETALVRYVPIQVPVHPTAVQLPLRILVVLSAPKDVQALDTKREQVMIKDAMAEWTAKEKVELYFLERATVAAISQAMRKFRPHVFHFVGHSRFEQAQASILLENEEGYAKVVNERIFREFFTDQPETRLAVINACQSATSSIHQPLTGLAPRLLQRQLSAVVAMQYPILDTIAIIFTREFYRSLALGYPVEAAISEARRGIYLEVGSQTPEWAIPVLFLRADHGQLFELETLAQPELQVIPERQIGPTGHIATNGGDFVYRDKTIQGDEVHGDKFVGNKTEVHIERIEQGAQVFLGPVQISQGHPPTIPSPPEPRYAPEPNGFVGRAVELEYYRQKLEVDSLAIICGMAGIGKTTLAAVLARQVSDINHIFWHSFHAEEGFDAIIWQLAGFLAHHGQSDLWQLLHSAPQTGGDLPPPETLLSYLLQLVRGQKYLFCLDDFQFVDEDPLLLELIDLLRAALRANELALIITSRRIPSFVHLSHFDPLNGLSLADTELLLTERNITLPSKLVANLHNETGGNAQFLTLSAEALHQTADPNHLLSRLAATDNIEHYLIKEIDDHLTQNERSVMEAIAILLGYPVTPAVIETILEGENIRRTLYNLRSRYLLTTTETELGYEYHQHATVQAFYYNLVGQRQRQAMHSRAAGHYETEEHDLLKAARHYQLAGNHSHAATVATTDIWKIINQGQVRALCNLLGRFRREQLEVEAWVHVNIVRGQAHAILGEGQQARTSYHDALSAVDGQPDSLGMQALYTRICQGMGALLEFEAPQDALAWLKRGLDLLSRRNSPEEAALHIRMGSVLFALGDFDQALASLEKGLALLPETPSQLRARALIDLGNVYSAQSNIAQGNVYTQQALKISQQLHDDFLILAIYRNQGIDKEITGQWQQAIVDYQSALTLAERLGSIVDQVGVANSLGILYTKMGQDNLALFHLSHAIELARNHNLNENLIYVLTSLAELYIQMADPESAVAPLNEAEQLAVKFETKHLLAAIHCQWAQVNLLRQELAATEVNIELALRIARELEIEAEEGKYLRIFGQVQTANGQIVQGLQTLAQSYEKLTNLDPYEAAYTQMVWGEILAVQGNVMQGHSLLRESRMTFRELGAQRELLAIARILSNIDSEAN